MSEGDGGVTTRTSAAERSKLRSGGQRSHRTGADSMPSAASRARGAEPQEPMHDNAGATTQPRCQSGLQITRNSRSGPCIPQPRQGLHGPHQNVGPRP
jgi:hypothetical protein